jgi:hypothetical protein
MDRTFPVRITGQNGRQQIGQSADKTDLGLSDNRNRNLTLFWEIKIYELYIFQSQYAFD